MSLPRRFLFYIFEYPPARAKYSYHVARLGLSVVRHSFPTFFFASKLLFSPAPSLHSTSTSIIMPAFEDPQSLLSISFYRLRAFVLLHDILLSIHIWPTLLLSLAFPFLLSFFFSLERYHIFTSHQTWWCFTFVLLPPTRYSILLVEITWCCSESNNLTLWGTLWFPCRPAIQTYCATCSILSPIYEHNMRWKSNLNVGWKQFWSLHRTNWPWCRKNWEMT